MSKPVTVDTGSFNGMGAIINWDNVKYVEGLADGGSEVHFLDGEIKVFDDISLDMVANGIYQD